MIVAREQLREITAINCSTLAGIITIFAGAKKEAINRQGLIMARS